MPQQRFKTALVLSGGSARALTHLGSIEELQKHDIPVDMVVATSMGAIIGALYIHYGDMRLVADKMRKLFQSDLFLRSVSEAADEVPVMGPYGFFNRFMTLLKRGVYYTHSMIRTTLIAEEAYSAIINDLIPDIEIEELSLPFGVVAMDVMKGEEVVIRKGSLRKAVSASAAIPGILPVIEFEGRMLADGGWVDNVPVAPAIDMGAHFVIAIDATLDVYGLGPPPTSALESLFRCNEITRILLNRERKNPADVLLVPQLGELYWANFSAIDRCIDAGREIIRDMLPFIQRQKRIRRLRTLWGLLHPARRGRWRHSFVMHG